MQQLDESHGMPLMTNFYSKLVLEALTRIDEVSNKEFLQLLQGLVSIGRADFKPDHLNKVLNDFVKRLQEQSLSFDEVIRVFELVHLYSQAGIVGSMQDD